MKIFNYCVALTMCLIGVFSISKLEAQSNPMESVGIQHNQYTKSVLQSITSLPSKSALDGFVLDKVRQAMGDNSIQSMVNFRSSDPFQELSTRGFSAAYIQEANKVASLAAQRLSVSQFWTNLAALESAAIPRLPASEVNSFYAFTAVAKYSYKFWSPPIIGGDGGQNFVGVPGGMGPTIFDNPPVFISVWKADAIGAGIGAWGGGIPGAIGGAVLGSVGAGIYNSFF
jgi:hypothetical protein